MNAQVLHAIGDLRYEQVPEPEAVSGEVLVRVMAAGICGSDVPRVYKTGAHRMPLIPGHEFSGVVERVFAEKQPGVDAGHTLVGKRAGVFPLIPCGSCSPCRQGHYELCRHYDYVGSRRDGAFAEFVAVPAANLIEIPENVTFEEAAMLEPMAVAVHAMRRGVRTRISPGATKRQLSDMRVAVCGVGTIGLLLSMFWLDVGVRELYLIGNKESQRERALALEKDSNGSDGSRIRFCNGGETDAVSWLKEQTGDGADIVFECVGKADTYEMTIKCAAPMGTVVLMGNPYGDMSLPRDVYWKILRDQITLTGTWNSSFDIAHSDGQTAQDEPETGDIGAWMDDWRYVLDRLASGSVHPSELISHRFSLAELERGLLIMRDKTEDYCKVMITYG